MPSDDLLAGVEFTGGSKDLLEGVQTGGEPYKPRRDVGFWETAGRTAASAATPVVRAIDMAAAGLAGAFERVFPQLAGEQERIFKMGQERAAGMEQFYGQQPEEEMNLPGALAGGIASLPIEMAGGFGAQHGIERTAQVLDRGGTGQEAALAGGVTGATRLGLNLLPLKVGGKIGAAVESKLGGALGGATTGAAVNVPGEALGTAAENLALPAAPGATLPERARGRGLAPGMESLGQDPLDPVNLATSAGLAAGMGGVGGALTKKAQKTPAAPPIPDALKPTEDGQFKTPNGATISKEQWDNASDRVRAGWLKAAAPPPPEPKIPVGEAKEIPMDQATAPEIPKTETARRAEIERLLADSDSPEVTATLKKELAKLDQVGKTREAQAKKAADKAELLAAAAKTDDPDLKKALLDRADKIMPAEKPLPVGDAKEIDVETVEPKVPEEQIPTGEAVEVDVERVEPAVVPRETAAPQQKGAPSEEAIETKPKEVPTEAPGKEKAVPADAGPPADSPGPSKQPAAPAAGVQPGLKTAAEWAREMARLQDEKPRPISKLYGKAGPTPEQAKTHADAMRKWNSEYRKANTAQKKALKQEQESQRAPQEKPEQGRVQPERGSGDEGRQAPEAGPGNRVQREAQGLPEGAVEGPQVAPGRGRELPPKEVDIAAVPGAVDAAQTRSAVRALGGQKAGNVAVAKLKIPDKPVQTGEDVAQVLAPMRRDTQEQFLALVTDDAGKPLAVIRHAKGGPTQTSIYPNALITSIAQVKGGKNVWFAHNHPSGNTTPSQADVHLQGTLEGTLRDSGMQTRGHVIIGPGGKSSFFAIKDAQVVPPAAIKPSLRKADVPVVESRFTRFAPDDEPVISDPQGARDVITKHFKPDESGLLILNSQNKAVGALPLTVDEMRKLRTGNVDTGLMKMMRSIGEVGGVFAMVKAGGDREGYQGARNIFSALDITGIQVLDIFQHDGGKLVSHSSQGTMPGSLGVEFQARESRSSKAPQGWDKVEPIPHFKNEDELDQALRAKFGAKLIDGLQESGILHYLSGKEDIPDRPATVGRLLEREDNTTHARLYWDRLTPETAPAVLMHEIGEHFGIIRMLGDERYKLLLSELVDMHTRGDKEIGEAWARVKRNYPNLAEGSPQFVREVAARLVENAPELPWVRRLLNEIRSWLYQQFGTTLGNRADADLIRGLATAALRKAGAGELPRMDKFVYPKFMRGRSPLTVSEMARAQTETPEFKRWFGDSKVVGADSRPLRVFHGTSASERGGSAFQSFETYGSNYGLFGQGSYFTADPSVADEYTAKGRGGSATVYAVYLAIKAPIDMDAKANRAAWEAGYPEVDFDQWAPDGDTNEAYYRAVEDELSDQGVPKYEGAEAMQDGLRRMGHDGITHMGGGRVKNADTSRRHRVFIAFDPEQIKSATGNRGTFDPASANISEMVGEPSYGGSTPRVPPLGAEERSELLARKFFDRFNRVAKVQKAAGITDEDKDITLADTLYRGRVQHEGDKLLRDYIEPIGKLLKAAKTEDLTAKDADDYLMALHAPERNRVIAARNDKMPDGGSGLTDQQAADIIDSFSPAQREHLDAIAAKVHQLNREKLQRMVESGLITPETRDMLNRQYRNYVPLKTLDEEDAALGIGRGYELRASDITTAMGRKSKAGSPIAASIMDASRTIIRGEKANVDRTIWNFASDPAAETFMRPYDPENPPPSVMSRKIGPDGMVKDVVDPLKVQDQTISLMVNGEQKRIFVDDELLRDQIRKVATMNDPGPVLRAIGQGTGAIGRMLTEFNPAFTVPNAVRDAWTVGLRAPAHGISRWKAVSGIPKAWGAIVNYKRGKNTPGARTYEEFQRVGGKIGAYGIQDVADTMRNLERAGADLGYDEQKGGLTRKGMNVLRGVANVLSQANEVFEYATRLSAYEQARAVGHSPKRAAAIAKDITVNFERSGEYGRVMNSLLVFANAALQGLYGTLRYAKNPAVQRGMLAIVATGIASQAWNELMGGVNEETGEPNVNTQNDSILDKNLVVFAPDSKVGFKIPLPQEYAALYAMGRRLFRGASQGDWAKEASGIAGALIDAALPVRLPEAQSGALSVGKAIIPTLGAPFADLWTNQNYFGAPIYVEQRDTTSPAPYYTLTRPQTSVLAKGVSEMLNSVTGGDEIEPGMSQRWLGPIVAPEGIEHLVGFYTGGAGQFVMQSANMAKQLAGDKTAMELNRTPIVNRFVFSEPTSYIGRRYRELEGQLEYALDKSKAGKPIDNEKLERAVPVFEESERELSVLRKQMRAAANAGEDVEELRKQARAAQSRVIRAFNGQPVQ